MPKRKITINRKPKEISLLKKEFIPDAIEWIVPDSWEAREKIDLVDGEINSLRYTLFKLFLAYLKASKTWNDWKGWWIHNRLRIQQRWNNYIVNYNGKEYNISPEESDDISEIILYYI